MKNAADPPSFCHPPSSFVSRGGELHLSNFGQMQLLRAMVERGVPLRMMVRGFSMAPFIRDQDVLTIAPMNGREPWPGQVLAFILPDTGRMAIHRVIARQGAGWLMRGDSALESDGIIFPENIIGRVICVERRGRAVHFGLGVQGALIAALNRGSALMRLIMLAGLPRRAAGCAVSWLQSLAVYRAVGKRYAPRIDTVVAGEADLQAVHRYFNSVEPYCANPPDPQVTDWVAKAGGKVIGHVQFVYHPETHFPWVGYWLFSLTVWRRYRRFGIGEALTSCVIQQARAQGAADLFLAVHDDNGRAIRLYSKLGFEHITLPALEPVFASEAQQCGRRRIVMRKRLSAS